MATSRFGITSSLTRKIKLELVQFIIQTTNGVATTPTKKAEILNNVFQSVFISEDLSSMPTLPVSTHPSLPQISITEHGVFSLLSQIDPHKACGPDNIPAQVLKELAQELSPMITHLF